MSCKGMKGNEASYGHSTEATDCTIQGSKYDWLVADDSKEEVFLTAATKIHLL